MRKRLSIRLARHRDLWLYKEWEESKADLTMTELAKSRNMSVQSVNKILKKVAKSKSL